MQGEETGSTQTSGTYCSHLQARQSQGARAGRGVEEETSCPDSVLQGTESGCVIVRSKSSIKPTHRLRQRVHGHGATKDHQFLKG